MLDVSTLQQFDFFTNFTLYAGANGFFRTISNVVILDHECIQDNYSDYNEGDFVLTNLIFAKENPEIIYSCFSKLMDTKISAIAIKSIFFNQLPQNVIDLANERQVPIFFFHSVYIEDIFLNITDYLRLKTNHNYHESLIDTILYKNNLATPTSNLLSNMVNDSHTWLSSMYISYKGLIDDFSIYRNLNKLLLKKNHLSYSSNLQFVKYKKGILFLYFYTAKLNTLLINENWEQVIRDLNLSQQSFYFGINNHPLPIKKVAISIQRSFYTNQNCILEKVNKKYYSTLSVENIFLPIFENTYIKEYVNDILYFINNNHSSQTNYIFDTLETFVICNFSIDDTSKLLFQHPNTIRYRLNKIKELLNIENDFQFQMIAFLITKCNN